MEMLHAGRSSERVRAAPSLEHEPERDRNELKVIGSKELKDLQFVPVTFGFVTGTN